MAHLEKIGPFFSRCAIRDVASLRKEKRNAFYIIHITKQGTKKMLWGTCRVYLGLNTKPPFIVFFQISLSSYNHKKWSDWTLDLVVDNYCCQFRQLFTALINDEVVLSPLCYVQRAFRFWPFRVSSTAYRSYFYQGMYA